MADVTSRGFPLPTSSTDMGDEMWFNLWKTRLWPYYELREGDDLYWYETPSKAIVWKTRIRHVEAFPYSSLAQALDTLDQRFSTQIDRSQTYLEGKPAEGYCLAYQVDPIERIHSPRPANVPKFNQQGWERGTRPEISAWLRSIGTSAQGTSSPDAPDPRGEDESTEGDLFAEWLQALANTDRATTNGVPAVHQGQTVLWLAQRALDGHPRMVAWAEAREPLRAAIVSAGGGPTPEYPLVALARSGVLDQVGLPEPLPTAHGRIESVLTQLNPSFGLPENIEQIFQQTPDAFDRLAESVSGGTEVTPDPPPNVASTTNPSIVDVWASILAAEGQTFHQKGGQAFTYEVHGSVVRPSTTQRNLSRTQFEAALSRLPVSGPGQLMDLQGPSYIYALLTDPRIIPPVWESGHLTFGEIPGNLPGTTYATYSELRDAGVHRPTQAGIGGTQADGADSMVLNGGYKDDRDYGDEIVYTGGGGQENGRQVSDQSWSRVNQALRVNQARGLPVRVIRGWAGDSTLSPPSGYRYDGLYSVVDSWMAPSSDGPLICRFKLVPNDKYLPPGEIGQDSDDRPERTPSTVMRIVRDTALAGQVKDLYDFTCQMTGNRLELPGGLAYAEGAHIRPLGAGHDGPDAITNILCLSPDAHVRFDRGAWVLTDELEVLDTNTGEIVGQLNLRSDHQIDVDHVRYHRRMFES